MSRETIPSVFPDVDVLLALAPEELAPVLLQVARSKSENGKFHLVAILNDLSGVPHDPKSGYPQQRRKAAESAISEAWAWLKANVLIIPEPGTNGSNGWHQVSRRGASLNTDADFNTYRQTVEFPRSLLHPKIAEAVWLDLIRGDLDTAVFKSFKAVEEAVRSAANYTNADYGVDLMRKAFNPKNGPLSDLQQLPAEREALSALFSGAIGSYKNPHSHRTVTISDPSEAREMVVLASHLLRIVDSRTKP